MRNKLKYVIALMGFVALFNAAKVMANENESSNIVNVEVQAEEPSPSRAKWMLLAIPVVVATVATGGVAALVGTGVVAAGSTAAANLTVAATALAFL